MSSELGLSVLCCWLLLASICVFSAFFSSTRWPSLFRLMTLRLGLNSDMDEADEVRADEETELVSVRNCLRPWFLCRSSGSLGTVLSTLRLPSEGGRQARLAMAQGSWNCLLGV